MGWYLDFLDPAVKGPWSWLIRADQYVMQAWRIPAYGVFYVLLLRDFLVARKLRRSAPDRDVPS